MYCEQIGKEIQDISNEIPFDIPDSWEWVRCSALGAIIRGSGIKRTETVERGLPCVRYGELYTTYNTSFTETISFIPKELFEQCKQISCGDVLFTLTGENKPDIAKTVAYLGDTPVAVGGDLAYWTHHGMNPLYLVYFMSSPYAISRKVNLATGDIIVHISGDKVGSFLIPVPPLSEQHRIVAKIEELLPYIERYGKAEEHLTALNTTFPEALKKSILQEAVQGKLVPQNPDDEPASVLLERIRAEKQALIKAGKIKRDKHKSVIVTRDKIPYEIIDGKERCIADEVPFELPESWCWCRLKNIVSLLGDGIHGTPEYSEIGEYHFINGNNLSEGSIIIKDDTKIVDESQYLKYKKELNETTVFVSINGTIGNIAFYNNEPVILGKSACYFNLIMKEFKAYIYWLLKTDYFLKYAITNATGSTIKNVSLKTMNDFYVPLPPLAEQKRIVEKIKELMQYCDKL